MGKALFCCFSRASLILKLSPINPQILRSVLQKQRPIFDPTKQFALTGLGNPTWGFRNLSYKRVNLVISQGKPKFETREVDPPMKYKWKPKKKFKLELKRKQQKRKAANKKNPRRLTIKGKKKKFANAEEVIKYKLEKAKIKEASLIEILKRYEVPKVQGPVVEPVELTGEERFFLKKMAQKKSNYAPVGRRGIFGGVILNMHLHWKKHETVKVICKCCKPGQIHEYADEIARLSGGIPIHVIGDNTIIFYRGKNYVRPKIMSPIDTLSNKRALEKFRYEESLESVRWFIASAEKQLESCRMPVALYGDQNDRNPMSVLENNPRVDTQKSDEHQNFGMEKHDSTSRGFSTKLSEVEAGSTDLRLSENDNDGEYEGFSSSESDLEIDNVIYSGSLVYLILITPPPLSNRTPTKSRMETTVETWNFISLDLAVDQSAVDTLFDMLV